MLTLLTFPGGPDQPSHSPFCLKAMCLLQMSGHPWQPKFLDAPSKMPHGRLPVLKTSDRLIADTHHIQTWLESQGVDFNPGLDDADMARSHTLIRMVEDNLRCGLVHDRWLRNDCWAHYRAVFFGNVPRPLRRLISNMVRRKVRQGLTAHGIAQFSEDDRLDRLERDIAAVTAALGDQLFLFGDTPTAADAAILPVLDMIRTLPCDTGLRRLMQQNTTLCTYADRTRAVLYPS